MNDLISIIIPIYNISKYVKRCIDSVLKQKYTNIEIILVDDGSTDDSGIICDEYAKKYSNVLVIHKKNAGLGMARNSGIETMHGKYVMFVDGDDYISTDRIWNMYNCLKKTDSDTCIAGFSREKNNQIKLVNNIFEGKIIFNKDIVKEIIPRMCGKYGNMTDYMEMAVWNGLYSSDIISKNNIRFPSERVLINEDLSFDIDYYSKSSKVCFSNNTGYFYCDNEGSLTTKYRENRFELQKVMYLELVDRTQKLGIYEICAQRLMTTFIAIARYSIKLEEKFEKQNSRKKAIENIKRICKDNVLKEVLLQYDGSWLTIKNRIVNYLIKKEYVFLLEIIMKLKNRFNI